MNSGDFLGLLKVFLVVCAVASIVAGIVKLATASKKGHGKWYKIKTVVTSVLSAIFFMVFVSMLGGEMDHSSAYIKAQHPVSVPYITYGQAIDRVCGNQKWSRMTSQSTTSGSAVVQMDAECMYADGKHRITIQFSYGVREFALIDAATPFEITFVGLDNAEETSVSDMQDIIYEMFVHYADNSGIVLDQTARDGILYSAGWKGARVSMDMEDETVAENLNQDIDNSNAGSSMEAAADSLTAGENLSADGLDEIAYPPEGWQDPDEEIDVMGIAGSYAGLNESSSASLSIYSGPSEEEIAAGEVGNALIDTGRGVSYEGLLITLGNNEYAVPNDAGREVRLQVYFFRGLYFDLYVDGEYIDTYYMVEQYVS